MGTETPVYIEDLNTAWPLAGDSRAEGDDHLRNIKVAIKGSFTSLGAAPVTATAAQLNYTNVTAGQVANDKAMVPTGSALDCNSIAFTEVNIDTGNIDAAVVLADGIAATTQSPSDDSVALATTAYVDAQTDADIALMKVTSTAQTTYSVGTNWTHSHGKGTVPDLILGYAILTGTDAGLGYAVGDKIMLSQKPQGGLVDAGLQVWASSSVLGAVVGDDLALSAYNKTTGASATLDVGQWSVYIEGIWFS